MKVLILAGGLGTRLSEYTDETPKPMVPIGDMPILMHIIKRYLSYGHKDFYIATGYKSEVINKYFASLGDLKKDEKDQNLSTFYLKSLKANINVVFSEPNTMTGGRIKRMEKYLNDGTFMLTYGDGVADIDINKLVDFHINHKKKATITVVRPPARFGFLRLDSDNVIDFREKSQLDEGWVNGGFFVLNSDIFNFIDGDQTYFEKEPLENLSKEGGLKAFKHSGFWQCVDTKRDLKLLNDMYQAKRTPWLK